jgi:hypothetical protein
MTSTRVRAFLIGDLHESSTIALIKVNGRSNQIH